MTQQQCQRCHQTFIITAADEAFYTMMAVPAPTWCAQCRQIRRLSFYNMRTLYQDTCDLCGKATLSTYSPDKPYTVYCNSCWWSDQWDALEYGQEYDFSQPFFTQFKKLMQVVPHMAMHSDTPTLENSQYCINAGHLKNCYLTFHADFVEDSYYCDNITNSKDCFDCNMVDQSELCYWSSNLKKCYRTFYTVDCSDSTDIYFSRNLSGCSNCFGSANLRNKQYYWYNQPLDKNTYEQKLAAAALDSYTAIQQTIAKTGRQWMKFPVKFMHGRNNQNVSGDYVENSINTLASYQVSQAENCKYIMLSGINPIRDSYDYLSWGNMVERAYECVGVGENVYNMKFSLHCWPNARDVEYSALALNSSNVFGCFGIRKKQFCILNKQYSEQEYFTLVKRIKQQMVNELYSDPIGQTYSYGEFFPLDLSMYAYNETLAQEYFPLNETQARTLGFGWQQPLEHDFSNSARPAAELPDRINDSSWETVNIIACTHAGECLHQCKQVFKIIKSEFDFYLTMQIPLPRLCPNCRLHERFKTRNPMSLWQRQCMCTQVDHGHAGRCATQFETTYSPDRKELVYCESCYQKEVN